MVASKLVRDALWLASVLLLASSRAAVDASDPEGTRVAEMPLAVTSQADAVSPLELPLLAMFKNMAISDPQKRHIRRLLDAQESYDFNAELSTVDILTRSGFHYELHNCTSVDGYQTELVRIVNPLVDRKHLRQIPVVLYTGQGTSPAAFLAASLGSQRPARWVPDDDHHKHSHAHQHAHHHDEHHHEHHHDHHEHQEQHPVVERQHSENNEEHHHEEQPPVEHHEEHHHEEDHAEHHDAIPVEYREESYANHHNGEHLEHHEPPVDQHEAHQHEGHEHEGQEHEGHEHEEHLHHDDPTHHLDRQLREKRNVESLLQLDYHLLGENNRSLAAVLANHGYDVWIVPTRGVDKQNRRRRDSSRSVERILESKLTLLKNRLPAKPAGGSAQAEVVESPPLVAKLREFVKSFTAHDYWSFSSDEIIEFELEIQLERVRMATNREKVSLITYSNGGFIAFAFLAAHPGYALKHLDVVLNLAPAVYVNKLNLAYALSGLLSHLTPPNSAFPVEQLHGLARGGFVQLCRSKTIRYSLCKLLLDQLYGPSDDQFRTHLELGLFDYIGRPQSALGVRQTLQATDAGQLIHYDHGLLGNLLFYEQLTAPDYELRRVDHPRVYIVAGERDAIVDGASLERLVEQLGTKPAKVLKIPGYNHLDLLAAHDNALRVNTPILQILNDRYLELDYYIEEEGKFGAEDLVRDIEHNRLNANDTGHLPDFAHYHVNGSVADDLLAHLEPGFKVDESRALADELDALAPVASNTTSHDRGQSTLPAGRLSGPGAAALAAAAASAPDSPVTIERQQQQGGALEAARATEHEPEHPQTSAAVSRVPHESQQAPQRHRLALGESHGHDNDANDEHVEAI